MAKYLITASYTAEGMKGLRKDKASGRRNVLRQACASVGGKLVGPCERSMVVEEPVAFWKNWSKQQFKESGAYTLGARSRR